MFFFKFADPLFSTSEAFAYKAWISLSAQQKFSLVFRTDTHMTICSILVGVVMQPLKHFTPLGPKGTLLSLRPKLVLWKQMTLVDETLPRATEDREGEGFS